MPAGLPSRQDVGNVTGRLVRAVREDTKRLCAGMRQVSVALEEGAGELGGIVEHLNRRLLLRVGRLVGEPLDGSLLGRIARDPGVRTKLLLLEGADGLRFCSQAGKAIGEDIDGVAAGHVLDMISGALRPAVVPPGAVTVSSRSATVRLPSRQVGRAIGRRGANVSLASRLLNIRIRVLISAAGGVLGVIAQIAEDVQKEQHRRELQDLRNGVRSAYREAAASVQASFWEQFDRFLSDFYEPELLAINAAADELTAQRADRCSDAAALRTLDERVAILVDRMIGSRQIIVAT